jgi:predicted PurR-regulated permease PerM
MTKRLQHEAGPATTDAALQTRQIWFTLLIIVLAIWMVLPFATPIAWAVVIAIAEWPLFRRGIARFPGHPLLVALGLTLATALLVILPLSFAAVALAQESQGALTWFQHVQQTGLPEPSWLHGLPLIGDRLANWWRANLVNGPAASALLAAISATSVLSWTRSIGAEVAKDSMLFLETLLVLAALLARGEQIAVQSEIVAHRMFGPFGTEFLHRITGAVRATVNGTILVSVLEGSIIGVAYAVAGVPQPLLFATFTIALALIPFGAWLAFGLASLILLGSDHALAAALLFAFGATVMTVGDNVVQPSVVGSAVKLPFLLALLGAFGGLAELGLVGLFVGPVVMAAALLVWRQWMSPPVLRDPPPAAIS